MCLGIGTSCVFGGGEYEGREVDREELEVSENRDRRRLLLQHQAKTINDERYKAGKSFKDLLDGSTR